MTLDEFFGSALFSLVTFGVAWGVLRVVSGSGAVGYVGAALALLAAWSLIRRRS